MTLPCEGPFDDPSVPAGLLSGINTTTGDAGEDAAFPTRVTTAHEVVCLVSAQLFRPLARSATTLRNAWNRKLFRRQSPKQGLSPDLSEADQAFLKM